MSKGVAITVAALIAVLIPLPGAFAISLLLLARRSARLSRQSRHESLVQYPLAKP